MIGLTRYASAPARSAWVLSAPAGSALVTIARTRASRCFVLSTKWMPLNAPSWTSVMRRSAGSASRGQIHHRPNCRFMSALDSQPGGLVGAASVSPAIEAGNPRSIAVEALRRSRPRVPAVPGLAPVPNRGVVEVGEHALVEALDVGVERPRPLDEAPHGRVVWRARRHGRLGDGLELPGLGHGRSKDDVDRGVAAREEQELQRVGVERPHVREVADVALEERHPARGVDCLEHDLRAGPQLVVRGLEEPREVAGLEVLDHL